MIRVLAADPDPEFGREVTGALARTKEFLMEGAATSLAELAGRLKGDFEGVVILGPGWDAEVLGSFLARFMQKYPTAHAVVLGSYMPKSLEQRALGAKAVVLRLPVSYSRLTEAIARAWETPTQPPKTEVASVPGRIITVFSTKGGVGKSVISTNLACCLARMKQRTVLVDLDLQFGDVGVMLGLCPERTIYDLASTEPGSVDIASYLTPHPTGLQALLAPLAPESADLIVSDKITEILTHLRETNDFVVVDTPAQFNDHVLALLDESDAVVLVTTMDMPSIKNLRLCLETLKLLGHSARRNLLVINRESPNLGLKVSEIEKALKMRAQVVIPNDMAVPLSVNRGVPVAIDSSEAPASRHIEQLAKLVAAGKQAGQSEQTKTGGRSHGIA